MRYEVITKGAESFLIVQVRHNLDYGFISQSGKSWVYRLDGTYVSYNGEIKGEKGKLTGYIHERFNGNIFKEKKHRIYGPADIFQHGFGNDDIRPAIMVHIQKIE